METNEQAVAEDTKESSQTSPETDGAREESLDELLNEFNGAESQPETEQKTEPDDMSEVISFIKETKAEKVRSEVENAVKVIHGELEDLPITERAIRRMLNGAAGENPALRQAWLARGDDPARFQKLLKRVAEDFRSDFRDIDKGATEDREAVAAAVRSASTKAPSDDFDEKAVKQMSDSEFERMIQEMGRA